MGIKGGVMRACVIAIFVAITVVALAHESTTAVESTVHHSTGSDAGKAARCSTVNGVAAGDLDCSNLFDTSCYAPTGWSSSSTSNPVCTDYWDGGIAGTVDQCPDGGISWKGVSVYAGTGLGVNRYNWCAAWDSAHALMGLASCTGDRRVCTKTFAGHIHD